MNVKIKKIAVLVGGWNSEREVSLSSGREVAKALRTCGYDVSVIDINRNIQELLTQLTPKPDVAFLCTIHGKWFEDGCLQGFLEMMNIPYTNSGPLASALAMHKAMARKCFIEASIPVAQGQVYHRHQVERGHVIEPPYVVKPLCEGSSFGVRMVRQDSDLKDLDQVWQYGETVLVEKYIPGREIMVLVMGTQAIGTIEVECQSDICDYTAKYVKGESKRIVPAPIHPQAQTQALDYALKAHLALGCEGVSRVDFRYDDTASDPGQLYVLEVNTQPGMTPTSFVPTIAAHHGIMFEDLVQWMVENPKCPQ